MVGADFREIAHCGGQFTVTIRRNEQGELQYATGMRHSRPVPAAMVGIYSLQQGIPVGMIKIGGIGAPFNPPPFPGCLVIFIASDSEGRFGHKCPQCSEYWRSRGPPSSWPMTCTYCGFRAMGHEFLTDAQRAYVQACCEMILEALSFEREGERVIEMDAAVDASAAKQKERPKYYYTEQAQQTVFTCVACGHWNDILGRFGYCSSCGTRNGLANLEAVIAATRAKVEGGAEADLYSAVRDLVSAFETMAQKYAEQLIRYIPLTARRRGKIPERFHQFRRCADAFDAVFDIAITKGLTEDDVKFAAMMFERRHVYEHKGGEADETYLEKSGDTSVRARQVIRETPENVHRLATMIARAGRNLHEGFHELLPPESAAIQLKKETDRYTSAASRR